MNPLRKYAVPFIMVSLVVWTTCSVPPPKETDSNHGIPALRILEGSTTFRASFIGMPSRSQPSSGRRISCLASFRERVFIGYGDWNENTGPIRLVSFNPQERRFDDGPMLATEAIDVMRVIGGELVVPEVDHTGWFWFYSDLHRFDGTKWFSLRLPRAVHIFDAAEFQGKLYVGYQFNPRNASDGMHRVAVFDGDRLVDAKAFEGDDVGRIWRLLPCGGRLYAFGENSSHVFDGRTWTLWSGPRTLGAPVSRAESDGRKAVVLLDSWKAYRIDDNGAVLLIDSFSEPIDVRFRDGVFYILDGGGSSLHPAVYRSDDLVAWELSLQFESDSPPTALEVHGGGFYIGLENGELWWLNSLK